MKKTLFLLTILTGLVIVTSAQKSRFGITAGATFASYKVESSGINITSDSKVGFTFGVLSSIPIGKSVDFQPALNFVQQGGNYNVEGYEEKLTLNGIEIPLNFIYHSTAGKGRFFAGAGPSLNYGISGKWEYDDGESDDVKFGSDAEDDFKPFQLAANFLAGFQFEKGFMLAVNYNFSLTNTANNDPDFPEFDATYHNRYWGLRLGYIFPQKVKTAAAK